MSYIPLDLGTHRVACMWDIVQACFRGHLETARGSAGGHPLRPRASIGGPRHNQPTAVPGQREAGPVSPVIAGGVWLGDDDRDQPLVLQLQLPVSAEELAAALYDDDRLSPADLAADQNVWGFAAAAITR